MNYLSANIRKAQAQLEKIQIMSEMEVELTFWSGDTDKFVLPNGETRSAEDLLTAIEPLEELKEEYQALCKDNAARLALM